VLVFTFGKKYSRRFIENIHKKIDFTIKFVELDLPKIPPHIKEQDLFYHRKEIPYARKYFPKSRMEYLHVDNFVAGEVMEHPEIKKYDFALQMDDDTFLIQEIDFDLFKFVRNNNYKFAPFTVRKLNHPKVRQCQIGLRELVKKYIKENNIKPRSSSLDKNGNWDSVAGRYPAIYDLTIFRNQNWEKWWNCVNESGGIYNEIHTLHMRIYYLDSDWHNFDFYKKGKCKHGGYGTVYQDRMHKTLRFVKNLYRKFQKT